LWPEEVFAQRRVYRRPPVRPRVVVGLGYGYPGYAHYYNPYWLGYGYGIGYGYGFGYGYGYGPYGPYPPYGYGYGYYGAELRTQVTPREAEVYVDGYLVGTVDDFDGIFQRLRVPLGEHEITIYKEGFRAVHQKMLFRPLESYNLRETMQPVAPGEAAEPRPTPSERAPESQGPPPRRRGAMPAPNDRTPDRGDRNADRFGAVAVRVQPADAEVIIDGERWDTPAGENRLLVELSEGTHRVEVRKAGFKTYNSTVTVRSGETVTLNVSLPSGG
jgi:hypothetical protein